jgi:hypothetical protein
MTHDERIKFLLVVCDCIDFYKEKEVYKAYLQSAAEHQFIPGQGWEEACQRLQRLQRDSAIGELQDAKFINHFDYATRGLAPEEAQALLEEVQRIRNNLSIRNN